MIFEVNNVNVQFLKNLVKTCAESGSRTHTTITDQEILNLLRLPISPSQQPGTLNLISACHKDHFRSFPR